MNVGLERVLADEQLLRAEIGLRDVGDVIPDVRERCEGAASVGRSGVNEDVDVKGGAAYPWTGNAVAPMTT
jgi:hypothetical protein